MSIVKCKCLGILAKMHGEFMHITPHEARALENQGLVEIMEGLESNKIINTTYLSKEDFTKNNMRILWVQDTRSISGGAELTNTFTVEIGNNLGYDIVGACNVDKLKTLISNCDLIIINNIHENIKLSDIVLQSGKKFIHFSHDYNRVPNDLVNKAETVVCLSPKHEEFMYKNYAPKKVTTLPLCIKTQLFIPVTKNHENILFVPVPAKHSSIEKINPYDYSCDTIKLGGEMSYQELIDYMLSVRHVYHCPERVETGGRVLLEAILCDAQVHTNNACGHTSWPFWNNKEQLIQELNKAPFLFWKEVESCLA